MFQLFQRPTCPLLRDSSDQKAQKTVLEVNKAMKESIKEHPDWPVYLKGPKELREENGFNSGFSNPL